MAGDEEKKKAKEVTISNKLAATILNLIKIFYFKKKIIKNPGNWTNSV